jgi:predicted phage terminase large subunit-like protein
MEPLDVTEAVVLAWVHMSPAGEGEVADLTVEGASHYVTSGGTIPSNCGFDELPHFTEYQYRYMSSRLRSSQGVPIRLRGTGNPDGPHLEWVRKRFEPWIDKRVDEGKSLWFSPDGAIVDKGTEHALSRCYIPGKLKDNPYLPAEYVSQLMALDPVTRAKLLDGDWDAVIGDGSLFHRSWWHHLPSAPVCARKVRAWDFGATKDGDPTEGVLMGDRGPTVSPRWVILDVVTVKAGPTEVHAAVRQTAEMDGRQVVVCIPQDPGQAGKDQAQSFQRELAGWDVRVRRPSASKVVRAGPFSSQVGARNVALVNGPWVQGFVAQAHSFPDGPHDDKIDAAADAFATLTEPSRATTSSHFDF